MPNQRAPDQKLYNFSASDGFVAFLDAHLAACGYDTRSRFIRDAIIEKLEAHGVRITDKVLALKLAPLRIGPQKFPGPTPAFNPASANESSSTSAEASKKAQAEIKKVVYRTRSRRPKKP